MDHQAIPVYAKVREHLLNCKERGYQIKETSIDHYRIRFGFVFAFQNDSPSSTTIDKGADQCADHTDQNDEKLEELLLILNDNTVKRSIPELVEEAMNELKEHIGEDEYVKLEKVLEENMQAEQKPSIADKKHDKNGENSEESMGKRIKDKIIQAKENLKGRIKQRLMRKTD
ncbi:hypothetical protein niasHS_008423 [Heterodera schachtii]|uniref:Uncharacterized protein n=1 Tax=Heterodera schachtii TaxID=97005 RepID=A0ABD2J1V1_HETSC